MAPPPAPPPPPRGGPNRPPGRPSQTTPGAPATSTTRRPPPPPPPPPKVPTAVSHAPPPLVQEPAAPLPSSYASTTSPTAAGGISHRRPAPSYTTAMPQAYPPTTTTTAVGTSTTTSYGYAAPVSSYGAPPAPATSARSQEQSKSKKLTYQNNSHVLWFLIPTGAFILWGHDAWVLQVILMNILCLYGLDLINTRDGLVIGIWVSGLLLTMVSGFGSLLQVDDADADTGSTMIMQLLRLAVDGMFFCALSCWATLQLQWLATEARSIAKGMENSLHSVLPVVSAAIGSYFVSVTLLQRGLGMDRIVTLAPHTFAGILALGMYVIGSCPTSFPSETLSSPKNGADAQTLQRSFCISSQTARLHSFLLLAIPGVMHVVMFRGRILSRNASSDDVWDLIVAWALPYVWHFLLLLASDTDSPYQWHIPVLFPKAGASTLQGAFVPMMVSLFVSFALQQRYIIPLCHSISYLFNGHNVPASWIVSTYLSSATLLFLFALWTWGRKSTITNEPLFGEYHEDVVQLSISAAGFLLGKAFGMPWNLTPLPILAFLGLSVWLTTRMLRYLSIFLFVIHATGVVVFSYRFASLDLTIALAVPGMSLGLIRFGTVVVVASILVGLVAGLAVRPAGGVGTEFLKRFDVPGILFLAYQFLLAILEMTLLKRKLPQSSEDLAGVDANPEELDQDVVYDHTAALLTSALIAAVALFSVRKKIISKLSFLLVLSLAISKALSVFADASEMDNRMRNERQDERKARQLLIRTVIGFALLVVVMTPQALLKPIHIKTSARYYKRSTSNGGSQSFSGVPARASTTILVYALVILPLTLIATVPYVLTPLIMALSSHYGGNAYYSTAPPLSELIGLALSIWGVATLSMLTHYLPDGGGETWKKVSALALLMGVGITISAPTVPGWLVGDDSQRGVSTNPYASISSVGSKLVIQGKSRTGGWGILAAALATLLAITGPLELKERRSPTGKKDTTVLLRLMVFGLLFGAGVAWFIVIQCLSAAPFAILFLVGLACIGVAFFGTITGVLGYFLELENLDEVNQINLVFLSAIAIFAGVIHVPTLLVTSIKTTAFGMGGYMSTYLLVCMIACLGVACSMRFRAVRDKASRKIANLHGVLSWVFALCILYGRYGVAGMDHAFDVTNFFGVPASIFGTLAVAPILLVLEGELSASAKRRSRAQGNKPPKDVVGLTLPWLGSHNRHVPLVGGTMGILLIVTLYAILLRGALGGAPTSHKDLMDRLFRGNKADSNLAVLAKKSITHSLALRTSARLAGSGIWTTDNFLGPLIHIGGLVATLPTLWLLLLVLSDAAAAAGQLLLSLPLNVVPLIFCRGIPSLTVLAILNLLVGGILSLLTRGRSSRMQL